MVAYLRANPPARSQFAVRTRRPTGLTVIHTAESLLDSVGPDTGAENVADFIRRRTTPGSYHDLVDSDTGIQLVEYSDQAWQDGTGSNPFAMSISFALSAADWPRLTPQKRDAFLWQGALAFARQQAWLKANGHPLTPLRRITKSQSDAGQAGFISHGERDPGRRSDPGAGFPWARFFEFCLAALSGTSLEEIDMSALFDTRHEGRNLFDWMVHLSALVTQVPANVWATPVSREVNGEIKKVNALQELADAKSAALRLEGREVTDVDEQSIIAGLSASLAETVKSSVRTMSAEDVRALADELADEMDRRERDSDPATGPVS